MSTPSEPDLKAAIARALERAASQDQSRLDVDELYETVNIYHRELEYQNDELRRIGEELEAARDSQRDLFEHAPVAYAVIDGDSHILSINQAFRRLFQLGDNAPDRPLHHWFMPDSQDAYYLHLRSVLRGTTAPSCVVRAMIKGHKVALRVQSNRLSTKSGPRVRCLLTDLTAELDTQQALAESEARFKSVVERATDGILITDRGGLVMVWNASMERLTGVGAPDAVGQPIWSVQARVAEHPKVDAASLERLRLFDLEYFAQLRAGRAPETREQRIRRTDGTLRTVLTTVYALSSDENTSFCTLFRDLTDEKELEAQLFQARKTEAIGLLAGGIAHDFNNLLGIIFSRLELARLRPGLTADLAHDLAQVESAAHRSADMTRQLLTYARKQAALTEVLELNQRVEGAMPLLRRLVGDLVHLDFFAESPKLVIRMDPAQVDQILTNLCANARDALPTGGYVHIGTRAVADGVELSVTDNGVGMDSATREKLFEPFFTTKKLGHGTGLGLATVHGIVYQNKGTVRVESAPGRGSTFTIRLPAYADPVAAVELPPRPPASPRVRTVLVVEDEPEILEFVVLALEGWGSTVHGAGSAEEALAWLEGAERLDLLVTDVLLPGLNGAQLAQRVGERFPDVGVLYMSGYSGNVLADQGVLTEQVRFLQKPFTLAELQAALGQTEGPSAPRGAPRPGT